MAMKRTITESQISQTFNLEDLLGKKPSERQKEVFFELAVDKIVDRTVDGDDVRKRKFKKYEQEYADRKGVDVTSVDLVLSGDMLNSFDESTKPMTLG
jgi:hypothetical protein